jgi:hypothetical protein
MFSPATIVRDTNGPARVRQHAVSGLGLFIAKAVPCEVDSPILGLCRAGSRARGRRHRAHVPQSTNPMDPIR